MMNGIILVDKPQGFTSHDVVAKLRGILHERRIGHSGTLDPMATGLLAVFVGRATRAVEFAESHEKEYIAAFRFGMVTDTQDVTGKVLEESGKTVSLEELQAVIPEFSGDIMQLPPMYSAIKVDGKKLYDLARSGVEIERKSRPVTIKELEVIGEEKGDFILRVMCSKGTYIRTLCHDIGQRLGTGAALSSLRRTAAGNFRIENALTIDEIRRLSESGEIEKALLPVDTLFSEYPSCVLAEWQLKKCLCGNSFETSEADGKYRVYDVSGTFLMLANVENGTMSTIKSFFEV
ncbi:MAG: tRNA pseudouridine(55) synthase TruB [Clostridia bacterium]|nr:tRNA pseudouridine(55) synthase TruB [Clostridia bacterium]